MRCVVSEISGRPRGPWSRRRNGAASPRTYIAYTENIADRPRLVTNPRSSRDLPSPACACHPDERSVRQSICGGAPYFSRPRMSGPRVGSFCIATTFRLPMGAEPPRSISPESLLVNGICRSRQSENPQTPGRPACTLPGPKAFLVANFDV